MFPVGMPRKWCLFFGLPWWLCGKESARNEARPRFNPWVEKIPWRSKWQPTSVFLPGESHGQRNLEVYSPWGHKESDMTEQLTLSHCISFVFSPRSVLFAPGCFSNLIGSLWILILFSKVLSILSFPFLSK